MCQLALNTWGVMQGTEQTAGHRLAEVFSLGLNCLKSFPGFKRWIFPLHDLHLTEVSGQCPWEEK